MLDSSKSRQRGWGGGGLCSLAVGKDNPFISCHLERAVRKANTRHASARGRDGEEGRENYTTYTR